MSSNKRFFCVRGFMKSGTNWLGSLLSSHETISVVGEFHWDQVVSAFNNNLKQLPIYQDEAAKTTARENFERMIRQTVESYAEPSATVIGERTPTTLIPIPVRNVPHISIRRDGRDVLVSRVFHLYNNPETTPLFDRIPEMKTTLQKFKADPWHFQKHPEELLCHQEMVQISIRFWTEHLERDELAVSLYPKLKVKFVRYEDLHRDVNQERKKLFEFLDVDPTKASKIHGNLKAGFKKERPSEFLRKGSIGDWTNYFTEQNKEIFKEYAGKQLIQYGYETSFDW
ncbi:MAG: sulfotransferase domain-containing protein [Mariniblastus sp.]